MSETKKVFVIMQIGNKELDSVFNKIIIPAFKEVDLTLEVLRVDKDNEGGILKREIIEFIKNSDLILADLTNERPNCYLEVGIAMGLEIAKGLEKFPKIIMTVKEDHNPSSPNFKPDKHKIHFDVSGYDIVFWNPDNLENFKDNLKGKIKTRLKQIEIHPKSSSTIKNKSASVIEKLERISKEGKHLWITPIIPVDYSRREFMLQGIKETGEIEVQKLDSNHHILIPMSKIKEIIPNLNQHFTLEIEGRLQTLSLHRSWRYFPENPKDEFGIRKSVVNTDSIVQELRNRDIDSRFCSIMDLESNMGMLWQVFYDEDGRYIRRSDRPTDQIFCIPKPKMLI